MTNDTIQPTQAYQPKTGARCGCKPGVQRDNCPTCEGTGMAIDFKTIRAHTVPVTLKTRPVTVAYSYKVAISTRYMRPTNTRGSRIKAIAGDGKGRTVTVHCDDGLNRDDNHGNAARALCDKMGWHGNLVGGETQDGYAFVFTNDTTEAR